MFLFIEALNNPAQAYKRQNSKISWVLVAITILVVTVFDPILTYFVNGSDYEVSINIGRILWLSILGFITYLAVCLVFFTVCKAFGSTTPATAYLRSWGISYIPTLLCALISVLAETFFYLFWNNSILAMLLSIIFVAILIWKCILYVSFLREVAMLKGKKAVGAFIVCGLFILVLAFANMYIGLKTPIV
jgi:hypothetical protein